MGRYISREDVRVRLIGKVRFTESEEDENKMPFILLDRLIAEAEGEVEHDLSPRYLAPLQTVDSREFKFLPERPTKNLLRMLCELKTVLLVLDTDFGRGTVNNGEEYAKGYEKRYKATLDKIMEQRDGWGWKYPPLPGLQLNYQNREADDGFQGMVLSTGQGDGSFPAKQINDPSENFWNAEIDE